MASELARIMAQIDPIGALVIARNVAREGFDASELQEAAITALAPHQHQTEQRSMKLPENLNPLARESAAEVLFQLDRLEEMAEDMRYRDGKKLIAHVSTIRESIGDTFPGGFEGDCCEGCGRPIGVDETAVFDQENSIHLCADCAPPPDEIAAQHVELREADPDNANLPRDEGWIEWPGGLISPVPPGVMVEVEYRNGKRAREHHLRAATADGFWNNLGMGTDIIRYRILPDAPADSRAADA